ncbi:MAG: DnaD domain protein [Mycoplasmataceae bacterium]|nr:DnaD domain protein [Mycoplasmataceae bacterium]
MVRKFDENYRYIVNTSSYFNMNDVYYSILLYQPIIKFESISVYLTLLSERMYLSNYSLTVRHERILSILGMSKNDFYNSICELERVGLVRTYFKKQLVGSTIVYEIFKPKKPKLFFDTKYLYNSYELSLGVTNSNITKEFFQLQNVSVSGYDDVTEIQNLDNYDYDYNNYTTSEIKKFSEDLGKTASLDKQKSLASESYGFVPKEPIIGKISDAIRRLNGDSEIINRDYETVNAIEERYQLFQPDIEYWALKIKTLMDVEGITSSSKLVKRIENILKVEINPSIDGDILRDDSNTYERNYSAEFLNSILSPDKNKEAKKEVVRREVVKDNNEIYSRKKHDYSFISELSKIDENTTESLRNDYAREIIKKSIEKDSLFDNNINYHTNITGFDFINEDKKTKEPEDKKEVKKEAKKEVNTKKSKTDSKPVVKEKVVVKDKPIKVEKNISSKDVDRMKDKLRLLKELTPEDYFKKRGKTISDNDIDTIDKLLGEKKIPSQVVNVIIDHNFNKNSYFNKNYSLKIGDTLKRKEIRTAEEAISFLRKTYSKKLSKNENQASLFNDVNSDVVDFGDIF